MLHTRILIVDDAEDTRDLLQRALQTEGYKALEAVNGAEALRVIEADETSFSANFFRGGTL